MVKYVVYLDVFWFVNFAADIYIILCVRRWMNYHTKISRCIMAAIIGATAACMRLVYRSESFVVTFLIYIITAMLMCIVAYGMSKIIKNTILLYFTGMILGGISDFIYFQAGLKNTMLIFALVAVVSHAIICMLDKRKMIADKKCEVDIIKNNKRLTVTAIIDTGNSLREPYKNRPVHILEKKEAQKLIDDMDNVLKMLIPFRSLGCDDGMIEGIIVDEICINKNNKRIIEYNSVVGIYNGKLSGDGMYTMIINPYSIEEREEL